MAQSTDSGILCQVIRKTLRVFIVKVVKYIHTIKMVIFFVITNSP